MFDTLLIITLFLLASLLVCLLTLRLNINVKHLCLFFHPSLILTDILKFRQVFYKNFADVTRKYLCRSLFLIKLQALEHLFIEPPGQPLLQVEKLVINNSDGIAMKLITKLYLKEL